LSLELSLAAFGPPQKGASHALAAAERNAAVLFVDNDTNNFFTRSGLLARAGVQLFGRARVEDLKCWRTWRLNRPP
jgi:hypothetical protein